MSETTQPMSLVRRQALFSTTLPDGRPNRLSPMDTADLLHLLRGYGYSVSQLSEFCHESQPWVRCMLEFLDFPVEIQDAIHQGKLSTHNAIGLRRSIPFDLWMEKLHDAIAMGDMAWANACHLYRNYDHLGNDNMVEATNANDLVYHVPTPMTAAEYLAKEQARREAWMKETHQFDVVGEVEEAEEIDILEIMSQRWLD